jgi:dUTP pyrophosphatase
MKIKLDSEAIMPRKAYETDGGFDLFAKDSQIVPAKESAVFDTGVHIELKHGTAGLLVSKSGLNVNHGILSDGLIDVGYTGSIRVKLYNHSGYDYKVNKGDKISQLVIIPIETPVLELVEEIDGGERGSNGFGSSGR